MPTRVEIFPWNDNFASGIQEIDDQHKRLVELLNLLVGHLAFQSPAPTMHKVFEELKAYTAYHFTAEENIWRTHFQDDDWEAMHKKSHETFIEQVLDIKSRESADNTDEIIEEIVAFLTHWLAMHIIESDKRMAKVVIALRSGVTLDQAKAIAEQEMSGAMRTLIDTVMSMYDKLASRTIQMTREISRRIRAEEELRTAQSEMIRLRDEALAASAAKSAFLANMSHELRTPLNGIIGMIGLAQQRMADSVGQEQLKKAQQAADHLLLIINDILDISKIEAHRLAFESTHFRLHAVLETTNSLVGHRAHAKGLDFAVVLPEALAEQELIGDPLRLGQILINLAGNAVKFTARGKITLRVSAQESTADNTRVRFEVEDTGIGIDAAQIDRLFNSFEQADVSTTRKYGGTGLGLAISKSLVDLMGGQIGVHSTPGQGSLFWFEINFPRPKAPSAYTAALANDDDPADTLRCTYSGYRILLAEDEPINQEVAQCILEDVGLVVDVTADGQAAIDLARTQDYDLILMDMQMPVVDGIDATRTIRAGTRNRDTPILAMTANAFAEYRDLCLQAGMNDYIAKPFVPATLFRTLLRWLGKAPAPTTDLSPFSVDNPVSPPVNNPPEH